MRNEKELIPKSGWVMLPLLVAGMIADIVLLALLIRSFADVRGGPSLAQGAGMVALFLPLIAMLVMLRGFFTLAPNKSVVVTLFGVYRGSVKRPGAQWINPFCARRPVSLRVRNLNTPTLKVNDHRGNPIEIAAVVVWQVSDTYRALFEVDDYDDFVKIQSESALRHLASLYPYDSQNEQELSLRGSLDEVSKALTTELLERLSQAGVVVQEARLSHLAYAPEIAGAMLRRQQADAIVSARFRIVEGAVGMVESALEHLEQKKIINLDDERKAAMVSNLLVVLCGDHGVQPVVNTGTLYT